MKMIASMGRKGGSGKTMVSHLLAHGLSRGYDLWTNLLLTDVRDKAPVAMNDHREYMISTITNTNTDRDVEAIDIIIKKTAQMEDSFLIIDGGANRTAIDHVIAPYCDVVFIPFGTSAEDVAVASADYRKISQIVKSKESETIVLLLMNRWPGSVAKRESLLAKPWIRDFMDMHGENGSLFPDYVPDMASFMEMANADDPRYTHAIDKIAIGFAEIVARKIGFELPPKVPKTRPFFTMVKNANDEANDRERAEADAATDNAARQLGEAFAALRQREKQVA